MASFVVAFLEMVTVSETGIIGLLMNFLAAASFAGVVSLIYKKVRTSRGALAGLFCGSLTLTAVMLLWNYLITPAYTGMPRAAVAAMLVPVFLPFNLIKAGLNSAIILLIYKPLMTTLRRARLLQDGGESGPAASAAPKYKLDVSLLVCAAIILAVCAAAIFIIMNYYAGK